MEDRVRYFNKFEHRGRGGLSQDELALEWRNNEGLERGRGVDYSRYGVVWGTAMKIHEYDLRD